MAGAGTPPRSAAINHSRERAGKARAAADPNGVAAAESASPPGVAPASASPASAALIASNLDPHAVLAALLEEIGQ